MTLDHLFVTARPCRDQSLDHGSRSTADRWARSLIDSGFVEGSARQHVGQGTANRCFYFHRFMLELLYVNDVAELDNEQALQLALRERFESSTASPFGIGCRPSSAEDRDPAFAAVPYRPAYLPETLHIDVAQALGPDEPLLFHLPFLPPFVEADTDDEPRDHPNGAKQLESIVLQRPGSVAAGLLSTVGIAAVDAGDRHRMSLHFGGVHGRADSLDRLALPEDLPVAISIHQ